MRFYICSITILLVLFSCSSTKPVVLNSENNNEEIAEVIIVPTDDIKTDSLEVEEIEELIDIDLSQLKKGAYPNIKNDTPFTREELKILHNNDGLEIEATPEVAHYFKYFLRDKREMLVRWIENARNYIPEVKQEFTEANLPLDLIYLPFLESGYNVKANSRVGAAGIWQFMPRTATSYGLNVNWWVDERRNPRLATPFAIKHLEYLHKKYNDWYLALAAYNAGEGRISRAMNSAKIYNYFDLAKSKYLPTETQKYVPQFIAIVKIMKNLEELGFQEINWGVDNNLERVSLPKAVDLIEFSRHIKLTWSDFIKYNPSYKRMVNDPSKVSTAFIPKELLDKAVTYLSSQKPLTNNGFIRYTVKSGDSWWYLSQMTDSNITTLKRLNNVSTNTLHIGQQIMLPAFSSQVSQTQVAAYIPPNNSSKNYDNLQTYTVKKGDTISSISIKFNIKLNSLFDANNLNTYSVLKIGQIIRLPGYPSTTTVVNNSQKSNNISKVVTKSNDRYYTVRYGDSIWLIAQKTQIPYKTLLTLNKMNSTTKLKIGDTILLY